MSDNNGQQQSGEGSGDLPSDYSQYQWHEMSAEDTQRMIDTQEAHGHRVTRQHFSTDAPPSRSLPLRIPPRSVNNDGNPYRPAPFNPLPFTAQESLFSTQAAPIRPFGGPFSSEQYQQWQVGHNAIQQHTPAMIGSQQYNEPVNTPSYPGPLTPQYGVLPPNIRYGPDQTLLSQHGLGRDHYQGQPSLPTEPPDYHHSWASSTASHASNVFGPYGNTGMIGHGPFASGPHGTSDQNSTNFAQPGHLGSTYNTAAPAPHLPTYQNPMQSAYLPSHGRTGPIGNIPEGPNQNRGQDYSSFPQQPRPPGDQSQNNSRFPIQRTYSTPRNSFGTKPQISEIERRQNRKPNKYLEKRRADYDVQIDRLYKAAKFLEEEGSMTKDEVDFLAPKNRDKLHGEDDILVKEKKRQAMTASNSAQERDDSASSSSSDVDDPTA